MNRSNAVDSLVFVSLVVLGASARLMLHEELPNFTPVAAIALFAGYFLRSQLLALATPVAILLISNIVIGPYNNWLTAIAVYGMLMLPVAFRTVLRSTFKLDSGNRGQAFASFLGLTGSSLVASVAFFVVTNFTCWLNPKMYDPTFAELVHCYVQALPFFANTLLGDLFFACTLFGGYAVVMQMATKQAALSPKNVRVITSG